MKNNNSSKTFVAIGIGAALFFVLGRFVAIPSPVPNTCLLYTSDAADDPPIV